MGVEDNYGKSDRRRSGFPHRQLVVAVCTKLSAIAGCCEWEFMRSRFKLDVSRLKKKDVKDMISHRISTLEDIRGKQKLSEKQKTELGTLRGVKGMYEKSEIHEQMKGLKTVEAKPHTRSGKPVKGYTRTRNVWTTDYESFIKRRPQMKTADLRNRLNEHYKESFTYSSLATKRSRLRRD